MVKARPAPISRPLPVVSPWPHRLAWALACTTFALISAGGLVTTYKAGMSVPDWPTTFGYWFYPLPRWLKIFWDAFLEHGHRMLGQAVGALAIAVMVAVWRRDPRKWLRWLVLGILAAVCLQGTLGGLRVIGNSLLLAKVHACNAPLCFSLCAALVAFTSPRWRQSGKPKPHVAAGRLRRSTLLLAGALFVEIILGAQLRHQPPDPAPAWFPLWVWLKLIGAGLIAIVLAWLLITVLRQVRDEPMITRRAKLLGALFSLQLVLGAATWVSNFGWPAWFTDYLWAIDYTVVAQGLLQVSVTTAHAAVASLTLAAAVALVLWSHRLLQPLGR